MRLSKCCWLLYAEALRGADDADLRLSEAGLQESATGPHSGSRINSTCLRGTAN